MPSLIDSVMATSAIQSFATSAAAGTYTVPNSGSDAWTVVEISVTQAVWIVYTGTATNTTGEYWPAGMVKCKKVQAGTVISFIRDTTDGRITFGVQV